MVSEEAVVEEVASVEAEVVVAAAEVSEAALLADKDATEMRTKMRPTTAAAMKTIESRTRPSALKTRRSLLLLTKITILLYEQER